MTAHAAPQDSLSTETMDRLQRFSELSQGQRVETLATLMQVSAETRAQILFKHVPSQLVRETVNAPGDVATLTAFKEWWRNQPRPGALVRRSTVDAHPNTGEPVHIHRDSFALDVTPDTAVRASTTLPASVPTVVPAPSGLSPFD